MPKKQKRDIGLDMMTGEKPRKSRLEKLTANWNKAAPEERDAFLAHMRQSGGLGAQDGAPQERLIANGRYLLVSTIKRLEAVMIRRRMTPAAVMAELGFAGQGSALTRALAAKSSLRLAVIAALTIWLDGQETA